MCKRRHELHAVLCFRLICVLCVPFLIDKSSAKKPTLAVKVFMTLRPSVYLPWQHKYSDTITDGEEKLDIILQDGPIKSRKRLLKYYKFMEGNSCAATLLIPMKKFAILIVNQQNLPERSLLKQISTLFNAYWLSKLAIILLLALVKKFLNLLHNCISPLVIIRASLPQWELDRCFSHVTSRYKRLCRLILY